MPASPLTKQITTANILGAAGSLWLNTGLPASGTPPGRLIIDPATGNPNSVENPNAVYLGGTRAGLKLNTSFELTLEYIDEQPSPYRIHISKENGNIEGEMMETLDLQKLAKMVTNGRLNTTGGYSQLSAGGLLTIAPMPVAVIFPTKTGEWGYFMLYSAYNALGISLNLTAKADTGIPFRLEGLGLPGRVAGDQLWQIFEGTPPAIP